MTVDELVSDPSCPFRNVGEDDGAHARRVLDVLDTDGDGFFDGLLMVTG